MKIALLTPFLGKSGHEKKIRKSLYQLLQKLSETHQVSLLVVDNNKKWARHENNFWRDSGADVSFVCSANGETYGAWAPCSNVWSQSATTPREAACLYAHLKTKHYDAVVYPDFKGLAYACLQAKQLGIAFPDTSFHCWMLGSHEWLRFNEQVFRSGVSLSQILYHDVYERYCVRHADVLWAQESFIADWHVQAGWIVPTVLRVGAPLSLDEEKIAPVPVVEEKASLPLVSILVPHYNGGETLEETLTSLAGQKYPRVEILILDDGSTEQSSLEVFRQETFRRKEDSRFRFIEGPNRDVGAARNFLASQAEGDYLVFVDPDNICPPDMTGKLVAATLHSGCDAVSCYRYVFKDAREIVDQRFHALAIHSGGDPVLALSANSLGDTNCCIRKQAFDNIGGFREVRGMMHHDWDILCRLVLKGGRLECYPEPLFYYRVNPKGMSHNRDRFKAKQQILQNYCDTVPPWGQRLLKATFPFLYYPNHLLGMADHGISLPGHLHSPENEIRRSWTWKLMAPFYKTERWIRSVLK